MCGIETTHVKQASMWRSAGGCRRQPTARLGAVARRVSPLQGGENWLGPSSQGVALGWRVVAPSARLGAVRVPVPCRRSFACAEKPLGHVAILAPCLCSAPESFSPGGAQRSRRQFDFKTGQWNAGFIQKTHGPLPAVLFVENLENDYVDAFLQNNFSFVSVVGGVSQEY